MQEREVARGDECMHVMVCSATFGASKRPFCRTGNSHQSCGLEEKKSVVLVELG